MKRQFVFEVCSLGGTKSPPRTWFDQVETVGIMLGAF